MGARVYYQVSDIRQSPQTYNVLVFDEFRRFKPLSNFMYADDPIYSFYAGIPMVPNLAVVPLKRLWAGDMTNARIASELWNARPELVLLRNTSDERPFGSLLATDYRVVYEDFRLRLYARSDVARKAKY